MEDSNPGYKDIGTKDKGQVAAKEPSKPSFSKPDGAQASQEAGNVKKESSRGEAVLDKQKKSDLAEGKRVATKTDRRDEKDRSKPSCKPGTVDDKAAVKSEAARSPVGKAKSTAPAKQKESKDAEASRSTVREKSSRSNHRVSSQPELTSRGKEAATNPSRARGSGKPMKVGHSKDSSELDQQGSRHAEKVTSKERRSSREHSARPQPAKAAAEDRSCKEALPQPPPLNQAPTSARQGRFDDNTGPPLPHWTILTWEWRNSLLTVQFVS